MAERKKREPLRVVVDGAGGRRIVDGAGNVGDPETGEVIGHESPGRSIEDLAAGGTQEFLVMPIIEGSQGRLDGRAGGREVTTSELKFKGGPLMMSGQFPEGARVRLLVEFEVTDVDFKLVRHQGHVVGKKRVHTGELIGYGQITKTRGNLLQLVDDINLEQPPDTSGKT